MDWWRVENKDTDTLVLGTTEWFCGEAWLGYRITDSRRPEVQQVGALRPKGLLGLAYWRTPCRSIASCFISCPPTIPTPPSPRPATTVAMVSHGNTCVMMPVHAPCADGHPPMRYGTETATMAMSSRGVPA